MLIYAHSRIGIEASDRGLLSFTGAYCLSLMAFERIPERVIMLQRYYRLREIVEVAAQNIGGVMYSIAGPIQTFSIAGWGVKGRPEFLDALLGAC